MSTGQSTKTITRVDDFSGIDRAHAGQAARDERGLVITEPQRETAVVVGVELNSEPGVLSLHQSLAELVLLADTAGIDVLAELTQRMHTPNPASFIGSGKVQELVEAVQTHDAQVVIFDVELSPRQQRELEGALGQHVKVIDRTALILDIFAKHARTREGIVQVELAQYEYRLPRLTRAWTHLARQAGGRVGGAGGGVGLRGPGETQLEMDRRQITRRIERLNRELRQIRDHRQRSSARRAQDPTLRLGLVGYTNAGKSTLLNQLTDAGVYADDRLFATLDPVTRMLKLPDGLRAYVTDTVGFIQKLPTTLVAAFRATLEAVNDVQLLLHVVDASQPNVEEHLLVVEEVLDTLGAGQTPMVLVLNKMDRLPPQADPQAAIPAASTAPYAAVVAVSALKGQGIEQLLRTVTEVLATQMQPVSVVLPYARGDLLSLMHQHGQIDSETYHAAGTHVSGRVPQPLAARLAEFATAA